MALRYVVQTGDPVLREKCAPVKNFGGELNALLGDMKQTLYAENGAGLAAPQIGVPIRVVVIDAGEGYYEMINPVIVSASGEQCGAEGCLSVKGKQGTVVRPNRVKATYFDRNGKKHKLTCDGFFARAVCLELDHLDGVLYTDKAQEVHDLPPEE